MSISLCIYVCICIYLCTFVHVYICTGKVLVQITGKSVRNRAKIQTSARLTADKGQTGLLKDIAHIDWTSSHETLHSKSPKTVIGTVALRLVTLARHPLLVLPSSSTMTGVALAWPLGANVPSSLTCQRNTCSEWLRQSDFQGGVCRE